MRTDLLQLHLRRLHQILSRARKTPSDVVAESRKEGFPCKECGNKFTRWSNLRRHISDIHEGYKNPEICKWCGKTFSAYEYMRVHINSMHLKIKYLCEYCGKEYYHYTSFRRHTKRKHRDEVKQNQES